MNGTGAFFGRFGFYLPRSDVGFTPSNLDRPRAPLAKCLGLQPAKRAYVVRHLTAIRRPVRRRTSVDLAIYLGRRARATGRLAQAAAPSLAAPGVCGTVIIYLHARAL
jgi:hypothetical protein